MSNPRISIVTPVYNPPPRVLEECIASVLGQSRGDWEMCLVDDGSTRTGVAEVLDHAAAIDPRIRVFRRAANGGIVAASNDALGMARGEFVAFLDHDDVIEPDALERVIEALDADPTIDYLYTDEDHLDEQGRPFEPFLKPDWSPERFRSQMYTCHFSVVRRSVVDAVGGFRTGFDGSQDYDLILRVTERCRTIHHIPEVLYHWRMGGDSVVGNTEAKPYAFEAGRRAIQEHCERVGIDAEVVDGAVRGVYRLNRRMARSPRVSVIVPTRGSARTVWGDRRVLVVDAVRSLIETSRYPDLEIVVVFDLDTPSAVIDELERLCGERLVLVPFDRPFNFSEKMNLGAAHASGELLLLLNDDVLVIDDDFIEVMAALAMEPDVGLVGARLLFSDGRLQHAGHLYAMGEPRHIFFQRGGQELGPSFLLVVQRECSGVTAACAMLRSSVFDEIGGFTTLLHNNFNDVDFSLKIRHLGYRIVWTPYASLYHFESQSRVTTVTADELAVLRHRWNDALWHDPYFNPGLDQMRDDWLVARSTRRPWTDRVRPDEPAGSALEPLVERGA